MKSYARACFFGASVIALLSAPALAHHPLKPTGHVGPMLAPRHVPSVTSGTWTPLINAFPGFSPDTALLLTDGTVMMHDICTRNWYRLTPNANGSYASGKWSTMARLPAGYAPLYFASKVLPDGRVIINGGEYNGSTCTNNWTNKGALYDPVSDTWTAVSPPTGWAQIGDAQSTVLADGHYMLANPFTTDVAIADISGTTVTWTALSGTGKADANDEEGWTLLPGNKFFTVDANRDLGLAFSDVELFSPLTNTFSAGAASQGSFVDPISHEIGPAVLLANGRVFQTGANSCGLATCPGHTGIYNPAHNTWTAGPDFPQISGQFYDVSDGPAALLPNGNVLIQTSPSFGINFNSPSHFFEFDGSALTQVNEPSSAPSIAAYEGRMLVLPTGQILWSSDIGDVELYTPTGNPYPGTKPKVVGVPTTLTRGTSGNTLSAKLLNGRSEGAYYGDDTQSSTNYPIVRIKNIASGRVCFARTHDFSSMAVASTATETALFDIPSATPTVGHPCDLGASQLQVIVNGVASVGVAVTVN
jgi:hypothetical protein